MAWQAEPRLVFRPACTGHNLSDTHKALGLGPGPQSGECWMWGVCLCLSKFLETAWVMGRREALTFFPGPVVEQGRSRQKHITVPEWGGTGLREEGESDTLSESPRSGGWGWDTSFSLTFCQGLQPHISPLPQTEFRSPCAFSFHGHPVPRQAPKRVCKVSPPGSGHCHLKRSLGVATVAISLP